MSRPVLLLSVVALAGCVADRHEQAVLCDDKGMAYVGLLYTDHVAWADRTPNLDAWCAQQMHTSK